MTSILKRAALAAALTAAAATTVLTSAGSAQAHYVGVGAGSDEAWHGTAAVQLDYEDWLFWTADQHIVCGQIKDEVNGQRQKLGLDLGITEGECILWMTDCMTRFGGNAWLIIPSDNAYYCADDQT
ncbi:MAG TPA: hypothetical protein VHW64_14405 [Nocardioides sp.]|jgi:hypothetical protein|uniref:hypothetical protein n=1 Tax=Nocardioides sp. TaxID=35761 RepID=UPI002E33B97B|nr:hypothetical protein [Nocardioides sp.]HEX3931892.1 hypothetical protein [Nocardioides sp.]